MVFFFFLNFILQINTYCELIWVSAWCYKLRFGEDDKWESSKSQSGVRKKISKQVFVIGIISPKEKFCTKVHRERRAS